MNPRYPVYIPSKGRWVSRLTMKTLDGMGVPYTVVVEPQELDDYASVIDQSKLLSLPFSNLGQGSIPARNFIWEHAIQCGFKRHWILDDNIGGFNRMNRNRQHGVATGTIFRCAEDFVDRYENVAIAGFQYDFFLKSKWPWPAFIVNTRIYSCILIDNSIPFRWRGRYNEDTDLSLRVLKSGMATVLFYAFTQEKSTTMTMKGGNTDELYVDDGRLKMAQSLVEQHPDCARISQKWGRFQHHVDYSRFKNNQLRLKEGSFFSDSINNYGMVLTEKQKTK
jgi:hypothetical protein